MLVHILLSLALLAAPLPTEADAQAAFNGGDYQQALRLYLKLASDPQVHEPDAIYGAHLSLVALYQHTNEVRYLCRALSLAERLVARNLFRDSAEKQSWSDRIDQDRQLLQSRECPTAAPLPLAKAKPRPEVPRNAQPLRTPAASQRALTGPALLITSAVLGAATSGLLVARRSVNQRMLAEGQAAQPLDEHERLSLLAQDALYGRLSIAAVVVGLSTAAFFTAGLISSTRSRKVRRVSFGPTLEARF